MEWRPKAGGRTLGRCKSLKSTLTKRKEKLKGQLKAKGFSVEVIGNSKQRKITLIAALKNKQLKLYNIENSRKNQKCPRCKTTVSFSNFHKSSILMQVILFFILRDILHEFNLLLDLLQPSMTLPKICPPSLTMNENCNFQKPGLLHISLRETSDSAISRERCSII